MSKLKCLFTVFHALALAAAIVFSTAGPAAAGGASPDNCEALEFIDIICIDAQTRETLGKVTIKAEYDEDRKDCMKNRDEIVPVCGRAYSRNFASVCGTWDHSRGSTPYKGTMPDTCSSSSN